MFYQKPSCGELRKRWEGLGACFDRLSNLFLCGVMPGEAKHGSDSVPPDIATRRQLAGSRFRGNDGRVITGGGMRPNRQNEMIYLMFFFANNWQ